jgi:O-antigen ligase
VKIPSGKILTGLLGLQLLAAIFIQAKMDYRAIGTLGEANSLAANTIFLLGLLVFPSRENKGEGGDKGNPSTSSGQVKGDRGGKESWWRVIGVIIGVVILLFTGSRSGVIALGILAIFYFVQRYSLKAAAGTGIFLLAVSLCLPFLQQNQLFENRATVWETALAAGVQKPLLGWGFGNTEIALQETAQRLSNALRYEYVDHSHNLFLEYWVQGGVIGFGVIAFLVIQAFYIFYRQKKLLELGILLGLVTMLSFNPLSIAVLLQFWWLIGVGLPMQQQHSVLRS